MTIKLHPKAEEDLHKALNYYSELSTQNNNLKEKFIYYLDLSFSKISKFPTIYPFETETSQKALMEKFPYIILYEYCKDFVMVLAIFHTKRNPKDLGNT